jgi:RHS repeat-associated protein
MTASGVKYQFDEGQHLIGEYGSGGNLIEETVWMDNTPVATLRPSGSGIAIYYVHTDHLNTPRKVSVPGSNVLVWRTDLDPFEVFPADNVPGDGINQNPSGLGNFVYNLGFPGQYFDPETTSVYNLNRDYAASLGRYLESDPIGLAGGSYSTYSYVDNDPISWADPLGLWVKRCSRTLGKTHAAVKPWSFRDILSLRHDYLDVSGQAIGFFPLNGGVMGAGSVQYGGENLSSASCSTVCGDDAFDKYVTAAADKIGAPTYCVLAIKGSLPNLAGLHNCQTWADDVLKEAKQQYLAHEHCPKCFR